MKSTRNFIPAQGYSRRIFKLRILGRHALLAALLTSIAQGRASQASDHNWVGYLIDTACAGDRKNNLSTLGPEHTRKCLEMPACRNSGYALLTDDLIVLRFDARGNNLSKELVESNTWRTGRKIRVVGDLDGDMILVKRVRCCFEK